MKNNNDSTQIIKKAENIILELLELHNNKIIPNKYFQELVYERVDCNDDDYRVKVLLKTVQLIPINLCVSPNKQCVFVAVEEY